MFYLDVEQWPRRHSVVGATVIVQRVILCSQELGAFRGDVTLLDHAHGAVVTDDVIKVVGGVVDLVEVGVILRQPADAAITTLVVALNVWKSKVISFQDQ